MSSFPLAVALQSSTSDIARFLTELAEVEVGEHEARLSGISASTESSVTGRERDGDLNARQLHAEKIRVRARLDAARITHQTITTLLSLGFTDWPSAAQSSSP